MDKHNSEIIKFVHRKHSNITYTIWLNDYFIEREIYRDMGKIQVADSKIF
jgi:hypothetical protein